MAKKNRIIYRDTATGRFASRSTWRRSRAHDGKRYRRQSIATKPKAVEKPLQKRIRTKVRPAAPPELREWLVTFTYEKTGRSFDLVVTARDEAGAFIFAKEFIAADPRGRKIAEARYHGWEITIAKAKVSIEKEGYVEYREHKK